MRSDTFYLGLATTFHDPALAVVSPDGEVLFAEATERRLQLKRAFGCHPDGAHWAGEILDTMVPAMANVVVATSWSDEYTSTLSRLGTQKSFQPNQLSRRPSNVLPSFLDGATERAFIPLLSAQQATAGIGTILALRRRGSEQPRVVRVERFGHHLTHAALAAASCGTDDATCLVVDGMSESGSTSAFSLAEGSLTPLSVDFGNLSPGFFYGLLTDLCGFDQAKGEEWKMMGLAPYGEPNEPLQDILRSMYRVHEGKLLRARPDAVNSAVTALESLAAEHASETGWADLARAAQTIFSEMMDVLVAQTLEIAPSRHLSLSGGCALNSSYNGSVLRRFNIERLSVPSAPADDGNAAGAAMLAWAQDNEGQLPGTGDYQSTFSPFLGSVPDMQRLAEISQHEPRLQNVGSDLVELTSDLLLDGAIVGWMQGRAEFGPRALGNRSILGDPRREDMKDRINALVKRREAFRPFAPSILEEFGSQWFEDFQLSPYMERTLRWKKEQQARVPAVVHEDGTGRLQTVNSDDHPLYHALISAFHAKTSVPIVLNTSLNVMGKPIVHSVEDALLLFHTAGLDVLIVGDWMLKR